MSFPRPTVSLSFKGTVLSASVSGGYDNVSRLFRYYITYSTMAMQSNDEGNYTVSATITHGQPAVTEVFTKTVFVAIYGESCSHLSMRGHMQRIYRVVASYAHATTLYHEIFAELLCTA